MNQNPLLIAACVLLGLAAAFLFESPNAATPSKDLPVAETEEESLSDDFADYGTAFPDTAVARLDITIDPADWQSMMDEAGTASSPMIGAGMQRMADAARQGMAIPGEGETVDPSNANRQAMPDSARFALLLFTGACDDCEAGEQITASVGARQVRGTCVETENGLIFQPTDALAPDIQSPSSMQPGAIPAAGDTQSDPDAPADRAPAQGGWAAPGAAVPPGEGLAGAGMQMDDRGDQSLTYVPCTVAFNGNTWLSVGIRIKGNSTLSRTVSSGSDKYPLHLDFDEFEDTNPKTEDQRFYGFDDLSLGNGVNDASLLRSYIAADVFRSFGVPAPEVAFYQLYIDAGDGSTFFGLYSVVETPDDPLLQTFFGNSDGNLYKPQGSGATWNTLDTRSFEKKSNRDEADWSDIEAAFEALNADRDDASRWRSGLEDVFDVDGFLRWLSINQLIGNWDAYGQMAHNYYLYASSADDLIHWIAWDLNESFSTGGKMGTASIDGENVGSSWPLIRYLLDDPVYHDVYVTYVAEALDSVFQPDTLEIQIRETYEAIAPYFLDEAGSLSDEAFLSSVDEATASMEQVVSVARDRAEDAMSYLGEQAYELAALLFSEIHYNPGSQQGDDEIYEFVEIYNRSDAPVDLSGYRLDEGIAYTFPDGLQLAGGACLIVAVDASSYTALDCTVLQWESGRLSNGGEAVRLVDSAGSWIDRVAYDDESLWPSEADGDGSSLELLSAERPNHIPASWAASAVVGGSPGGFAPDGQSNSY